MFGTALATVLLATTAAAPHHRQEGHHRRGCLTRACDGRADHAYLRHLRKARRKREAEGGPWSTSTASYYDDSGTTASEHHATLGFAHLGPGEGAYAGMAFGTRVEFCAARCAVGTMDDHGPYVAGREFDLDEALKDAIGASDLGTVRWRIVHG